MTKKKLILHPYLFALLPALILLTNNAETIPLRQTLLPLVLALAVARLIWAVFDRFIKDRALSALLFSPFIVFLFSYGMLYEFFRGNGGWKPGNSLAFVSLSALLAFCYILYFRLVMKAGNSPQKFRANGFFTTLAGVLIVYNLFQVGFARAKAHRELSPENLPAPFEAAVPRPDIYFIILDAYAGLDEMEQIFRHDNSGFAERLRRKGFFVATHSKSRFDSTYLSLATSLNMEPIDIKDTSLQLSDVNSFLASSLSMENLLDRKVYSLVRNNRVTRILKANGYRYVHLGSWFYYTRYSQWADQVFNHFGFRPENEFLCLLSEASAARIPLIVINKLSARKSVLLEFNDLNGVPDLPGPKFVFAHIICPHPPYFFGPNGEKPVLASPADDKTLYRDQHIFTTRQVEKLVDTILARSKTPPVIILQSDHGSRIDPAYSHDIFNAIYFPGGGGRDLYDTLSPQNTFRVVFNRFFGARYPLLSDDAPAGAPPAAGN